MNLAQFAHILSLICEAMPVTERVIYARCGTQRDDVDDV